MMSQTDWTEIKSAIQRCPAAERYRLQPKLDRVIRTLRAAGVTVPAEARQLNAELQAEAIEARFDNVPV